MDTEMTLLIIPIFLAFYLQHLYLKDLYYRKSKEIERTAYLRGVKAGKERNKE